ncbi:MAG: CPXCG motif-containing cysteine-rich protein [Gammaproteobacteria bacterium]|nr:CPXCG motif-containing cysteine-rich protein [Gammaproteobacteria bacterium]NIR82692.1 CPXCG motif-containing cysteine-rich protein [Gammaproteobacteria bacterium]NIR89399.1 CPXCG motif-containing cysteine-rich protein [Gammaproteobacteria bacterium]NIU03840.1 CPXCG motif-containing cysteine-rich protein [Gammaproteobacteria bacterium]NIV51174.1 CPXCG motif-containing cysteine-rich protein [Gammaproteobacteria bacterium]
MLTETTIVCPYCWETCEMTVDCSAGEQRYIEDCPVCCHPIELRVRLDESGELIELEATRLDA